MGLVASKREPNGKGSPCYGYVRQRYKARALLYPFMEPNSGQAQGRAFLIYTKMGLIYTLFTPNALPRKEGQNRPKTLREGRSDGFWASLGLCVFYTKFHLIYTLFTPIGKAFSGH